MQARKRSGTPSAASSTSKPPEPVTFFLDKSLDSASVVTALRAAGAAVERLTEHFPKGSPVNQTAARSFSVALASSSVSRPFALGR